MENKQNYTDIELAAEKSANAVVDEFGAKYSADGMVLFDAPKDSVSYDIRKGTKIIYDMAFLECCQSLRSVSIPDSVTEIDKGAFFSCKSLKQIIIPRGKRKKFEKLLPKELHPCLIEQ